MKNVFSVCLSLIMMFTFTLTGFAHEHHEIVSLNTDSNSYASSGYVIFKDTDLVVWSITNTSSDHDLHYSMYPMPTSWCGTVSPIKEGTLKPNETISGSKFGHHFLSNGCKLVIQGVSGYGSLHVQTETN